MRVLSTLMLSTSTSTSIYVPSGLSTSTSMSTEIRYSSTTSTSTKYSGPNPAGDVVSITSSMARESPSFWTAWRRSAVLLLLGNSNGKRRSDGRTSSKAIKIPWETCRTISGCWGNSFVQVSLKWTSFPPTGSCSFLFAALTASAPPPDLFC